jgi:hypothetical protein
MGIIFARFKPHHAMSNMCSVRIAQSGSRQCGSKPPRGRSRRSHGQTMVPTLGRARSGRSDPNDFSSLRPSDASGSPIERVKSFLSARKRQRCPASDPLSGTPRCWQRGEKPWFSNITSSPKRPASTATRHAAHQFVQTARASRQRKESAEMHRNHRPRFQ